MTNVVDSYRGMVAAEECDHLGHMNIQFYLARVSDAAWSVMHAIGLSPRFNRDNRIGIAAVGQEVEYRAELVGGDLIHMRSGISGVTEKKLFFVHCLRNTDTGKVAMISRVTTLCMSLDQRRSVPLPDDVRRRAEAMVVTEDDL